MTVVDLVSVVRIEHRRALALADEVEAKSRKWPLAEHGAAKAVRALVALESRHEAAEARVLWPVVRDVLPQYAEMRALAHQQEREARRLLHALRRAAGTEAGVELAGRAVPALRIHIALEEREILPALEATLSRYYALRLGPVYEEVSASGPTRPHPHTPAIPGVLALVTPLARRTDRLRDFLRLR